MESHSDNNNNKRQTRSSLSRYRSLTAVDSLYPGGGGGSSSNHSEIDQQEQEDVAMCLMMLSRDSSGHKSCFNFSAESSDNNSVILERGSSSYHVGGKKKDLDFVICNKKSKQIVAEEEVHVNSDSGYFENGVKELESDDSVDGFVRNYSFKNPNVDFGSRVDYYDGHGGGDSRKRKVRDFVGNFSFDCPESDENSVKKIKQDYCDNNSNDVNPKKGSKFECWICNKTFKTHQALGGHIISHRRTGDNSLVNTRNPTKLQSWSPKNMGTKIMPSKPKKVKGHKCPYCPKVFKSGQALGGHKRSHMIGASGGLLPPEKKPSNHRAPPPEPQQKQPPLIDLNLPAPMEDDGSGNSQFMAW